MKLVALTMATCGVLILTGPPNAKATSLVNACPNAVWGIYKERGATRKLEREMHRTETKSNFNASKVRSCAYAHWVHVYWHKLHVQRKSEYAAWLKQQQQVSSPNWLVNAFMCIHSHEGAWNANTGNGYYGGVQFGWNEWQQYGGQYASRADLASPAQQIAAAIAYYNVSGFSPWPNTARMCGLL